MVAKNSRKRISPSRQRYETNNPVISIRVPKELYQKLVEVRQTTRQSWTDLLRVALRLQAPVLTPRKPSQKELEEEFERCFTMAYDEGEADAKREYLVTYRCSVCSGPIDIEHAQEKQAAAQYMHDAGWGHAKCHNAIR